MKIEMRAGERSAGLEGMRDRKNETSWHFSHFAIWLADKLDAGVFGVGVQSDKVEWH